MTTIDDTIIKEASAPIVSLGLSESLARFYVFIDKVNPSKPSLDDEWQKFPYSQQLINNGIPITTKQAIIALQNAELVEYGYVHSDKPHLSRRGYVPSGILDYVSSN